MQSPVQLVSPPDSLEIQEFQFKLQRCVQIYDPSYSLPATKLNLVAAASRLGLLFVGAPDNHLHVLSVKQLISGEGKKCARRIIQLPSTPVHLASNSDSQLLSIVLEKNGSLTIAVYETKSFSQQAPKAIKEIQLSTAPGIQLCSLEWNPCQADSLAVCTSDGKLSIFQCKPNSIDLQSKPTNARCLSWSPKGKQIVTGNSDGTISQFKPDLTPVKIIPAPLLYENNPVEVLSIHWISTYQFGVVYNDSSSSENRACLVILNTPKTGSPMCVNYEDICYSMDSSRCIQFYLTHISQWGVMLASSSNSMEMGVLGTTDQSNWQQWTQLDEARGELPLTDNKLENYPAGVCFDNTATIQLPWGDNAFLPQMPMIHILSHTGLLSTFFAINILPNMPPLCINPEELMLPANFLTEEIPTAPKMNVIPPKIVQQDISFNISQNMASTPTLPKMDRNIFGSINNNLTKPEQEFKKPEEKNPQFNSKVLNFPSTTSINNQPFSFSNTATKAPDTTTSNTAIIQNSTHSFTKPSFVDAQNKLQASFESQLNSKTDVNDAKPNNENKTEMQTIGKDIIKAMLVKEVHNFQQELLDLLEKCKKINTEIGSAEEMSKIATIISESENPLKNKWSDQDIKKQVAVLKHSLISTCAFLAEAKMQPISGELEQLSQLDPVSTDKMQSIKLSTYYIQSQLEQINNALDEQWEIFQEECKKKSLALRGISDNDYMMMPTLDKIYQPLLKQSDILSKQQAIVSSLEKSIASLKLPKKSGTEKYSNKLDNNDNLPMHGLSISMRNINLQSSHNFCKNNTKESVQNMNKKHDALRNLLKNHKTVTIKPTKVDAPSILEILQDWKNEFFIKDTNKNEEVDTKSKQNVPADIKIESTLPSKEFIGSKEITNQQVSEFNPLSNLNSFVSTMNNNQKNSIIPNLSLSSEKNTSIFPSVTETKVDKPAKFIDTKPIASSILPNISAINPPAVSSTKVVAPPNVTIFTPSTISQSPVFNFMTNTKTTASFSSVPNFSKPSDTVEKANITTSVAAAQPAQSAGNLSFDTKVFFPATSLGSIESTKTTATTIQKNTFDFSFKNPNSTASSSVPIFGFSSASLSNTVPSLASTAPTFGNTPSIFSNTTTTVSSTAPTFGSAPSNSSSTVTTFISTAPTFGNSATVFGGTSFGSAALSFGSSTSSFGTAVPTFGNEPSTISSSISSTTLTVTSSSSDNKNISTSNTTSVQNQGIKLPSFAGFNSEKVQNESIKTPGFNFSISNLSVSSNSSTPKETISSQPQSIFNVSQTSSIFNSPSISLTGTSLGKLEPSISISPLNPVTSTSNLTNIEPTITITPLNVPTIDTNTKKEENPVSEVSNSENENKPNSIQNETPVTTKSTPVIGDFGFGNLSTSSSIFGNQSQPKSTNISSASSIFGGLNLSTSNAQSDVSKISTDSTFSIAKSPSNIFGQPSTPNTCASALFGAANAAIDTSTVSLFGSTSISTTSTTSMFKTPQTTATSVFGGFGGQSTFGSPGNSIFGGTGTSTFGQTQNNSVFGGAPAFGALGSNTQSSNIFGTQTNNLFGGADTAAQNVFGGSPIAKSTFGAPAASSPTAPQQTSIFGSPVSTVSGPVFGGSPTFGSKAVFGQPASFGSPSGSFGMFSGNDQTSVAQSGFGSPSGFGKPPEVFGRNPEFGAAPAFGSPPAFGASPTFGGGANAFSSNLNMQSGFGTGTQQSSTFESLATQSSLSFGNLAQQSQQAQPSQPVFQGSSSFSTWR